MATYTFDKIDYGGNTYVVSDSGALQLTGGQVTGPVTFGDSISVDEATLGDLVVNGSGSFTNNLQVNTINGVTVGSSPKFTDNNTTYSAGTGLSLSSTTFSVKLGYTTSGNNRAVQADSNGNLYVTQKDDNTTYYLQTYTTRQTDADVAWHSNIYIKYLLASSSMTTNKPTFTGDGVTKRTHDGMILHLSWDNDGGWDTQIAIPNTGDMISTRGGTGKDGDVQAWTDWVSYARADKAISNITRSGTTFTATRADGTTFTFTQQDNNTTYSAGTGLSLSSTTFSLATSGTTTGSYGPSADASPAHSGTFSVPYITVDKYGRVTAISTKTITLPASGNTDAKVTQSATTTSDWRKVLVHYTTNTSGADVPASVTNQVYAAKGIEVQPSTGTLHAEALTTKKITPLITGGSQTAAVTTSPYKPALWKFNAGIAPADGNIVVIQAPGGGHSYGEFLSLDNGTTYKPITHSGTGKMTTHYASGSPIALIYDSDWTATSMYPLAGGTSTGTITGGAWRVINGYLDGNTYPQAQCETAAATAAKTASMTNFTATANRHIMVNIRYANTSATAITLNINGTGNKPIYINGSASSTSNYTLPAGSYLVYYNGTNYYFRTDGQLQSANGILTANAGTVTSVTLTQGTGITVSSSGTAITSSGSRTISLAYSVGDVIITSTNTNPSAHYGGTWELIDKQFKSQDVTPALTYDTTYTNSSNVTFVARASGHSIYIRTRITLLRNISGDVSPITWDVTKIGFASTGAVFVYYPSVTGGISFEGCSDRVRVYNGAGIVHTTYLLTSKYSNMVDSYCDKFFWKRTA